MELNTLMKSEAGRTSRGLKSVSYDKIGLWCPVMCKRGPSIRANCKFNTEKMKERYLTSWQWRYLRNWLIVLIVLNWNSKMDFEMKFLKSILKISFLMWSSKMNWQMQNLFYSSLRTEFFILMRVALVVLHRNYIHCLKKMSFSVNKVFIKFWSTRRQKCFFMFFSSRCSCWLAALDKNKQFNFGKPMFWAFLLPIGLILIYNIVLLVITSMTTCKVEPRLTR